MNINELVKNRRSIFPRTYNGEPIDRALIEQMLENANWAPTHKFTEPWRFKVFHSEVSRASLGDFLAETYKNTIDPEKFSQKKYEKSSNNPRRSGCVIAICYQRDPEASIPEWEEIASVACAVQNMWLTASAHGIGSYWSSPGFIKHIGPFLKLKG